MSSHSLSQNDIKVLDQVRQRLSQLTKTLQSLQAQILISDPLPAWPDLMQMSSVISQNLTSLSTLLAENEPLLAALAVYPLPSFPGRTQEALLEQLLRKKLEPDIEDWVAEGRNLAEKKSAAELDSLRKLWTWAPQAANELARRHQFIGNDYTREEVANGVDKVVTGLRRKLVVPEEDSSGDEEDGDEDEEDGEADMGMVGVRRGSEAKGGVEFDIRANAKDPAGMGGGPKSIPVVAQLRFMCTGSLR